MKVLNWVARIAASLAIMFIAMVSLTRATDTIRQPESVVQTTYEYDNYFYTDSSETQQDATAAADTKNSKDASVAEQGIVRIPRKQRPQARKPSTRRRLPRRNLGNCRNLISCRGTRSPWAAGSNKVLRSITFRPEDRFNGPVTTNDRDREYQLNQAWLYFDRPTNTDGCGWDLGGHIDVVYGTDWRFGQCFGLENRIDSPNSFYGLILPQFYAEVAVNDLTVKMGHFATNTSLEKVPAVATSSTRTAT